ncbi:DUF4189 domain-containing protein [Allochromatium humboldtianum]|uniref:DUF4189 domain-containing protein n=1 Tax=Allochromatium humboldtianum TaxID=504901 RepID=A0A850R976_9GAMM|nr:DUF4189 domain-containing protein [Allochromatium humboldtianum]
MGRLQKQTAKRHAVVLCKSRKPLHLGSFGAKNCSLILFRKCLSSASSKKQEKRMSTHGDTRKAAFEAACQRCGELLDFLLNYLTRRPP